MPHTLAHLIAAERTHVADLMTADVVTASPELALDQLVARLLEHDLSRAPVVDRHGRPIGMIGKTDLVVEQHRRVVDGEPPASTVRDVMTPIAFTVHTTTSVADAARRMLRDHFHAVPVIGPTGELAGMLSATDIMAWVAGLHPQPPR